jgi:hypothetical protein
LRAFHAQLCEGTPVAPTRRPKGRLISTILALVAVLPAAAWAASPADPVRDRYRADFAAALDGYAALGTAATARAGQGLSPLGDDWAARMNAVDAHLVRHEPTFFPMMHRPWTREAAVFANLQGARMWLWSIHDALKDGADGVDSIDVVGGRVRAELLDNFTQYLAKARSLMDGGRFAGSYFDDTLVPILANYCTYPEDGREVAPSFDDPKLFDDVAATPATPGARVSEGHT